MTQNRRIFLNVIATYFRSLYSLAVGLFCGRWTLMALGEVDYGLMGVVGGLTGFITFFNGILASAVGRFYAFSVGVAQVNGNEARGLEECRRWFNTALMAHTVVPLILVCIGYPVGVWAVRNFLTIPADRIEACVWVFRFVCVSTFVGMVNVPFRAMYGAKQYIAELTIYSFVTTTANAFFLYYMISHPGVWLAKFAFFTCLLSVTPQLIICLRACLIFPECRLRWAYLGDWIRLRRICGYAGWQFFGVLGSLLRGQGIMVLVNKYYGPRVNAGMAIGSSVNSHTTTLSGSLVGALSPAITNLCGAGDYEKMRKLAFRACKFGLAFVLVFSLPLSLEIDEVLRLWLKTPPAFASGFCLLMMTVHVIDGSSTGHMLAINAKGRIAAYQFVVGTVLLLALPLAWGFAAMGYGPYSVSVAILIVALTATLARVSFARFLVGMSVMRWCRHVVIPVVLVAILSLGAGSLSRFFMSASVARLAVSTFLCEVVFVPLLWLVIFDDEERSFVRERIIKKLKKW